MDQMLNDVSSVVSPEMQAQQQMAEQEKLLRQSEVNEIAGKVRQEAYEKGRREAEAQLAQMKATSALSEEQVRQIVMEQTQKAQQEAARLAMAQQVVGSFASKMQAGSAEYQDFEEKVSTLPLAKMPEIVQLANSVDNTADVMYEIASKPYKAGNLLNLARNMPELALVEMQNLSASIKKNKQAAQTIQTPEPLGQMKPSSIPAESGVSGVSNLRKQDWLRR